MSNPRYGSGRKQFVGQGIEADLGKLDPAAYPGAVAYSDGELYYSDGSEWVVPQDEVDIARPRNLSPTTAAEQAQLRLSSFRSPTGETQTGIIFEINTAGLPEFGQGASLITRTVTSQVASLYNISYPDDGFEPGETIWWRARYLGTNGSQSQFSIPTAQIFPDLITTPSPVTPSNSITGTVTLTPYDSAPVFGLQYYQTQVEFYAIGAVPGVDTPITTVTQTGGAVTTTPIPPLVAGLSYQWRGRYTGRVNSGSPTIISAWSTSRSIFLGAASIVLEYDMDFVVGRTIQLPLGPSAPVGEAYSVTVDWGDNTSQVFTTGGVKSKTYSVGFAPTGGRFTVTISGRMTSYGSFSVSAQPGLVRVENIGLTMGLTSLASMLYLTTANLEYVTPNLPETVTDLTSFMQSSTANPASLSGLNTSNVTNMSGMFRLAPIFNQPINGWNVGKVTNMSGLFDRASSFNQNIGAWDVSKVTNMTAMLGTNIGNATSQAFNNGGSPDINNWNTSSVTNMSGMFNGSPFNQPIGNWNVSNVTNMVGMFAGSTFNQPIGTWNVGNVTNINVMFQSSTSFNQNIGAWDVSKVTTMERMFYNALAFNNGGSSSINNWNTSAVTNMSYMLSNSGQGGTYVFNQPIGNWNVSNVTNMVGMLAQANLFNQPIGTWNVGNVTNMNNLFVASPVFNQNLSAWDVSKVTNMAGMFAACTAFNNGGSSNISNWNTGAVIDMNYMFQRTTSFNQPIGSWNTANVEYMLSMFDNTGNATVHTFNQPIGNWNVSKVTTFTSFAWSNNALDQDLGGWDLRTAGTTMLFLLRAGAFSQENYSRTLIGWANYIAATDGPYTVSLSLGIVSGSQLYNANNYVTGQRFNNAVAARAFLVGGRVVSVTGASDTNANTTYTYNGATQTYDAANGWKFAILTTSWALYNASAVLQATGSGGGYGTGPHVTTSWTGVLSAATVLRTGASWTITGDAAA